ncbi:MAG: hypothetical protein A3I66_00770 [Burkholderiales bacterium RIFCSPLOWO2_02_FULL_57_36]|nr:MAG: hypothetical protein A3I66_00770 [Burkholderiales bacterium RIFCSPLOWO2_02_FULL_57_36]
MPSITITLTDTPQGGVSIAHDFKPAVGSPCSRAQSVALEIISRTQRDWGTPVSSTNKSGSTAKQAPPANLK